MDAEVRGGRFSPLNPARAAAKAELSGVRVQQGWAQCGEKHGGLGRGDRAPLSLGNLAALVQVL